MKTIRWDLPNPKPSDKDKSHNYPDNNLGRRPSLSLRGGKNNASDESDGRGLGGKQAVQGLSKQLVDPFNSQPAFNSSQIAMFFEF